MADMTPQHGDYTINLPVTFDYRGGRSENKKNKILASVIVILVSAVVMVAIALNESLIIWQRVLIPVIVFLIGMFIMRFVILKEVYFSDIYEGLLESDYELDTKNIWRVFDIDDEYPYVHYFQNGVKGVFIRMERDTIIGKPDSIIFDHYDAIGDAYNLAHSLNMNIVHLDYMDNVGNDIRLERMFDDLSDVSNPDMYAMLLDIYENLQEEMSFNYTSHDIYLCLTRDLVPNFAYNVQSVANRMLGGNFITYKILNKFETGAVCKVLFNLEDFSVVEACEGIVEKQIHRGIVPIKVIHSDGSVTELNKTVAEKKAIEEQRLKEEEERKKSKHRYKNKEKNPKMSKNKKKASGEDEVIELF